MGASSKIEWTDASWNPIRARNLVTGKIGWHCEHATTGCEFCYAESMNKRLGTGLPFKPGHRKDIEIFLDAKMLLAPLRWRKPRMIFLNSMTDTFASFVKDEWLDKMFAVMALCPQHTFQILSKRAERMREYLSRHRPIPLREHLLNLVRKDADLNKRWLHITPTDFPLPNVWLGTSAERQEEADERIPHVLQTPAAVRFVSAEPLLGPIDFCEITDNVSRKLIDATTGFTMSSEYVPSNVAKLDWVIVGGESGKSARPMYPGWVRDIRDQCEAAGVAYFFKQWGEYGPCELHAPGRAAISVVLKDGRHMLGRRVLDHPEESDAEMICKFGKKAAGRLLDGREYNAMPEVRTA